MIWWILLIVILTVAADPILGLDILSRILPKPAPPAQPEPRDEAALLDSWRAKQLCPKCREPVSRPGFLCDECSPPLTRADL